MSGIFFKYGVTLYWRPPLQILGTPPLFPLICDDAPVKKILAIDRPRVVACTNCCGFRSAVRTPPASACPCSSVEICLRPSRRRYCGPLASAASIAERRFQLTHYSDSHCWARSCFSGLWINPGPPGRHQIDFWPRLICVGVYERRKAKRCVTR